MDRKAKAAAKKVDSRIERVYRERCANITIPMMEISNIFKVGREAIEAGADDSVMGDNIAAYVERVRVK